MWEDELVGECKILLQTVTLQVEHKDQWLLKLDPTVGYSVSGANRFFTSYTSGPTSLVPNLFCHKYVP